MNWKQEFYETGSGEARSRAKQLRALGYKVVSSSLGHQVTKVGSVKTTMLTILNDDGNIPPAKSDYFAVGV